MSPIENRAAAVTWAREEASRIVDGAYDARPLDVFNAAQRMEHVLTRFQWLDEDFPRAVADFVFGWSLSGAEADAAIRAAAAEPAGGPITGRTTVSPAGVSRSVASPSGGVGL